MNFVSITYIQWPFEVHMRADNALFTDNHIRPDDGIGTDLGA